MHRAFSSCAHSLVLFMTHKKTISISIQSDFFFACLFHLLDFLRHLQLNVRYRWTPHTMVLFCFLGHLQWSRLFHAAKRPRTSMSFPNQYQLLLPFCLRLISFYKWKEEENEEYGNLPHDFPQKKRVEHGKKEQKSTHFNLTAEWAMISHVIELYSLDIVIVKYLRFNFKIPVEFLSRQEWWNFFIREEPQANENVNTHFLKRLLFLLKLL